ncbi:MAG: flagellar hook-length control protein FliK [Rhodospirillaceae bacterium]|nr:flagellar hook-length control protein FliK [Rhodospirillaceae bacterium]
MSTAAQQGDGGAKAGSTVQQQTAQLAQTLGQDTKDSVDVSVSKDAETLTSRPSVSLTAGSAVASDAKAQGQTGQHAANPNGKAAQNAQVANNANQAQNGQSQSQNQQTGNQNTQNQTALQASAQGKSGAGNAGGIHNAGPNAAGGEATSNTNSLTGSTGTQQTPQSQQSAQATNAARPQQAAQASVAEQVSVKITKALQAGNDRITIRLNPAELGRVEVKMELTHDGRTTAIVTADNKDTLDLLRRDSADLQKALEEGGMQLNDADLNFNLRGEENQAAEDGEGGSGGKAGEEEIEDEFADAEPPVIVAHEGGVLVNGRVDVRA